MRRKCQGGTCRIVSEYNLSRYFLARSMHETLPPLMNSYSCSMRCGFKAATLCRSPENVCHKALKQPAWWTTFLKAFWSTQEALDIVQQPSKVIEWLLTVRGRQEWRRRKNWLSGVSSEIPACSICIIIELLFRFLISAHWFFFLPLSRAKSRGIDHYAYASSVTFCPSVPLVSYIWFYTLLLICQSLLFCEFNAS